MASLHKYYMIQQSKMIAVILYNFCAFQYLFFTNIRKLYSVVLIYATNMKLLSRCEKSERIGGSIEVRLGQALAADTPPACRI